MTKLHQILHLFLILILFAYKSFVDAKVDLSFQIKDDFSCGPKGNIVCSGNASTTAQGLLKLLPDSKGRDRTYYRLARGSALYKTPLRILDRSAKRAASFSASFSFQIEVDQAHILSSPGDGMAFVLFPNQSFMGQPGGSLGAYVASPTDLVGTVLAVEFDTFVNPEWDFEDKAGDITYGTKHVGINVNTVRSLKAKMVTEFNMVAVKRVFAWVDYDSAEPSLEVRVSDRFVKPKTAFLSYALNLFDAFGDQEQAWVGFSAANGALYSFCTVYDLSFTSSLGKPDTTVSPPMLGMAPPPDPVENLSPSYHPQLAPAPAPVNDPNFSFDINHGFRCGSSSKENMFCNGNATTTEDGLLKLLPDPQRRNEGPLYYSGAVGTALFKEPVRLLDHPAGRAASFSASFSFNIEVDTKNPDYSPGDGLAFVLFPNPSYMGGPGELLGALRSMIEVKNDTEGTVLAVEFDTYLNLNDLNLTANHVGLDVDYPVSWAANALTEFNLVTVKRVYAWVDHDCTVPSFEVRVSSKPNRPTKAFFSYPLDLFDVLGDQELAYVGFSSANGGGHAFVNVYDVSFTSSLESSPYRSPPTSALAPVLMGPVPSPEVHTNSPEPQPHHYVIPSGSMTPSSHTPSEDTNPRNATAATPAYSTKLNPSLLAGATFCTWTALLVS